METEMKLCKDCAHVYKEPMFPNWKNVQIDKYTCMKDSTIDLVSGFRSRGVDCIDQRAKVSATPNRCGEAGIYWKRNKNE